MAYKETKYYNDDLPYFWNVAKSVGPSMPNQSGDVALVQAMLRKAYDKSFIASLTIDGKLGPQTKAAINKFQSDFSTYSVAAKLEPLDRDGIVTHANNFGYDNPSGKIAAFTIVALNFTLCSNYPNVWKNLPFLPELPVFLRAQLFKTHP
jgi:peptidoglycan hydrolase-like protein with peptidoglycan-binding domain